MKKRLFRKLLFLSIFMLCGYAQAQTVSGTVSDANGPLPGAAVVVKGTSNGATTDFDGKYTLNEVAPDAVLVISFVGYVTQEINVAGQSTIDVTLVEDANVLNEVVVVGYTTQTRGDLTGAVASVDISEAIKTPVVSAAELLEGRVSGVSIVNSGVPGGAPKVNIRGFGTSNNTNPLYIIDGVQTDDPNVLSNINAADIEQMNVLKDASAAIYGARAANGVIIVTTKSGKYNMGKARLSVNFYAGSAEVVNIPDFLNPVQHGNMIWESLSNDGAVLTHPQYGSGPTPVVPTQLLNLPPSAPTTVTVKPGGTKWADEILRSASTQNISVSLENGGETGRYYLSASYLNREGVLLETGYKRGITRLNSEFKALNKKITIGEHLSVSFARQQNPGQSGVSGPGVQINRAFRASPLIPVFDDAGNYAGPYSNGTGLSNVNNPVATLERNKYNYDRNAQIFGDLYLSAELIEGLTFKTLASGSLRAIDNRRFSALDPEAAEPVSTNTLAEGNINLFNWTWTNTLNFNKTFGDHVLNALVGIEALEERAKGDQISITGFLFETPDFYLLSNGTGTPNVDFAFDRTNTLFSIFGTANYTYKGKYLATVTVRRDKSSKFIGDNRSDTFPSFSAGWVISKEDFFPQDAIVNRLKFKASYGEIGNQTLPRTLPGVNVSILSNQFANYAFDGSTIATGAILSQVGNPNLRWETSKSTNVGVDVGMFNNKLSVAAEYFKIKTEGLITPSSASNPSTGLEGDNPLLNVGTIERKGVDINLNYQDETSSGFSYGIDMNVSTYKNEVTQLDSDLFGQSFRGGSITLTRLGGSISEFYGRVVEGIFASESEVASAADQNFPTDADGVGRFRYKDLNNDGVINDDDRTFIGSPHPDFTYGINLNAAYKGFDLSAFFSGSQGNDVYNYEKIFTDFPTFFNGNRSTRVLNSWSPTNTGASLPALSQTITNSETAPNSFFVEDGSFFRLKNLQIGYTLPSKLTDKANLSSVRVYLQGTNLFTITGYDGLDPEVISNRGNLTLGVDFQSFPISRILSVGVNIKL
ncbi:MAG TPA: TonB-dependent receptor [Flavobacteriia bacterium]|nr:TonB-dependent receptor [Flavobacteriia bacterium]